MDQNIPTLDYNSRTVYECFNNPFKADCGSLAMHLPLITIDDRPPPHKRYRYTPYLLPSAISVASENSVSTFSTSSDSLDILPTDDPNTLHVLEKDMPLNGRFQRGCCSMKHCLKRCYKKTRFYCSTCADEDNQFYYCHGFSNVSLATRN